MRNKGVTRYGTSSIVTNVFLQAYEDSAVDIRGISFVTFFHAGDWNFIGGNMEFFKGHNIPQTS